MVKLLRYFLGCLLAFSALNAFGGGIYAIMGAENVPVEWLKGSPFTSYFVPGLILFFIVGGSFLTSSVLMFLNSKHAFKASYFSVFIVFPLKYSFALSSSMLRFSIFFTSLAVK